MKLYQFVLNKQVDHPEYTLLEIITDLVKDEKLDHIDIADEIREDKSLYDLIRQECIELKLIKETNNSLDITDIF